MGEKARRKEVRGQGTREVEDVSQDSLYPSPVLRNMDTTFKPDRTGFNETETDGAHRSTCLA